MTWIGEMNIGEKGEDTACRFLEGKGHHIVERNFRIKLGEIDVVSKKGKKLFFVEVKSSVTEGGSSAHFEVQSPEERVNVFKLKKLSRTVQVYLEKKYKNREVEWEFWVIGVIFDMEKKIAFVKVIPEILAERY